KASSCPGRSRPVGRAPATTAIWSSWSTFGRRLHQAAVSGPPGELVTVGQLELPQHRRHMRLDRLHRDEQLLGDLFVGVPTSDQPKDLALTLGQPVQVVVDARGFGPGEGVEDESGQPRREDGIAFGYPADGRDQV